MFEELPSWIRHTIRWTSPGWYIFLLIMVVVIIVLAFYVAFSDHGTDHYPQDHIRQ